MVCFSGPLLLSLSTAVMGNVWTPVSIVLVNVLRRNVTIWSSRCWVWTQTSNPLQTTSMSVTITVNLDLLFMCVDYTEFVVWIKFFQATHHPSQWQSDDSSRWSSRYQFCWFVDRTSREYTKMWALFHLAFQKLYNEDREEKIFCLLDRKGCIGFYFGSHLHSGCRLHSCLTV